MTLIGMQRHNIKVLLYKKCFTCHTLTNKQLQTLEIKLFQKRQQNNKQNMTSDNTVNTTQPKKVEVVMASAFIKYTYLVNFFFNLSATSDSQTSSGCCPSGHITSCLSSKLCQHPKAYTFLALSARIFDSVHQWMILW